jgi:EPS-associated MarR family transcriptional regulator
MNGTDEIHFRVLRMLQQQPQMTQRDLARHLGVSLGKANYCLQALVQRGFIKVENFRHSDHKLGYIYLLTPHGIEEKARVTVRFLRNRMAEFDALKQEISEIQATLVADSETIRDGVAGRAGSAPLAPPEAPLPEAPTAGALL